MTNSEMIKFTDEMRKDKALQRRVLAVLERYD